MAMAEDSDLSERDVEEKDGDDLPLSGEQGGDNPQALADPGADEPEEVEGEDFERNRRIIEAVLLTADTPVSPGRLLGLFKGLSGRDIRRAVDELNERYDAGQHAMRIIEISGGFQISTLKEFGPWVRKFHDRGQVRLSQAGLETLAIIAFKQPVTRIEVDSVRGVESGGVIRTLMELNMIRLVGRSEGLGRPMLFGTTKEFMVHFGLKSLADLPKPKELEELLAAGASKATESVGDGDPQIDDGDSDRQGDFDPQVDFGAPSTTEENALVEGVEPVHEEAEFTQPLSELSAAETDDMSDDESDRSALADRGDADDDGSKEPEAE